MLLVILLACGDEDSGGFGGAGSGGGGADDSGPTGDDSGAAGDDSGGGGDDSGSSSDPDAPVITKVEGGFGTVAGDDVIELQVHFTDAQKDVQGGTLFLAYEASDNRSDEVTDTIDAADLEGDMVWVILSPVDTRLTYDFTLQIQDKKGHLSEEAFHTVKK